ncbi:MAG: Histidine--tRNA ligase [candidate division WS2 bacterium ADurb.Bin280]|uniref:Histidine--tRNA ligase n=1 Tax=candidate division WS2 bacterium ADurb.Bin280 TaxID=1852829 RepID=A0A1V5SFA2_9BACT|nr:MAG: Histidine--tRNA ligase [candidate division WS2 bacterium ADurb.Bin280]
MIQRPRGTVDFIDEQFKQKQDLERRFSDFFYKKNYIGIETPLFESKDLFVRTVGDQTDIVQKELFELEQKSDTKYALRPEITASIIRALAESGSLKTKPKPINVFSYGPCFRYEKPQKGRRRQFNQLDLESIGRSDASSDEEFIVNVVEFIELISPKKILLSISTFGSEERKAEYAKDLTKYFADKKDSLCELCQKRIDKNPFRVLDCKNPDCKTICQDAPEISLNQEERERFQNTVSNIEQRISPKGQTSIKIDKTMVRGLDYYTGIVFEFSLVDDETRSGSIGGGGRYDNLVGELSSINLPAIGVGLGVERIIDAIE